MVVTTGTGQKGGAGVLHVQDIDRAAPVSKRQCQRNPLTMGAGRGINRVLKLEPPDQDRAASASPK